VTTRQPPQALRTAPRQQRARRRIEQLLDAAAEVFDEVGYDKATTSMVAERAAVSPGTFYRWFPDKATLADALAERYLEDMGEMYRSLLDSDPDEPAAELVSRVIQALTAMVTTHPALGALLASVIAPGNPSPAGALLRDNMHAQLEAVLDLRVPGIDPEDRTRVARLLLDVVLTLLTTVGHLPEAEQPRTAQEYVDLILSYLDAKFPPEDDPAWSDPARRVRPIRSAPQVAADRADRAD
jgi:AcrR family transcriptional regulator